MGNPMKRAMLKARYDKFVKLWNNERLFQSIALKDGLQLPDGQNVLGHKPTFAMWLAAVRQGKLQPKQEIKAVEVKETAWEE